MSTVYHRPADPSGDDSYVRPLFADRCQAGFPSPATDYAEQELDLNSYCISRPAATFFLRASGESMNQAGVQNGDLLVVDRAEKPQHGDIVIAEIDGEFTVKRLLLRPRPAIRRQLVLPTRANYTGRTLQCDIKSRLLLPSLSFSCSFHLSVRTYIRDGSAGLPPPPP